MTIRGVRGAITVDTDQRELVLAATRELFQAILQANSGLRPIDVASVFLTVTDDIFSVHPALAARQMGWDQVPMLCAREIPVVNSLPLCIRVLLHWNTDRPQGEIRHVYLRRAVTLRPDLVQANEPIETGERFP
ncbi:MAG: chorismate mutase [Anaerolineales bacterium]|nr:chorismate mutase [Anaerolineales bacterium]